jgi:hypothetical protein
MSTPADVTVGRVLLSMTSALSTSALRWAAILMSFAVTCVALYRPEPWRVGAAAVFVGLVSPLWLRKAQND